MKLPCCNYTVRCVANRSAFKNFKGIVLETHTIGHDDPVVRRRGGPVCKVAFDIMGTTHIELIPVRNLIWGKRL